MIRMTRNEKRDKEFQKVYNEVLEQGKKENRALKEARLIVQQRASKVHY